MFNSYIIEVGSEPAGIIVRDGRGFRFFASAKPFYELEGRFFGTPRDAQTAALRRAESCGEKSHRKAASAPGGRPPLISANEGREA